MNQDHLAVEGIRAASRTIVRELGFMRPTLAGTAYSPSSVHALLEADARGTLTAAQLVQTVGLDKSSVSRMVARLVEAGELAESTSRDDGRVKALQLTAKGRRTVNGIHSFGTHQVEEALGRLNSLQQHAVAEGLRTYAYALEAARTGASDASLGAIEVAAGYRPGVVGRVTEMHATFYARHSDFGQFFESRVASDLAEFVGRLAVSCNRIWVAVQNGRIVGSIAIDGQDLGDGDAHLRWFILDDGCRGGGVGRRLIAEAVEFCDLQGFSAMQLWTFKGLDAARRLYESFGFELVREERGEQWGSTVTEQQFTRTRR